MPPLVVFLVRAGGDPESEFESLQRGLRGAGAGVDVAAVRAAGGPLAVAGQGVVHAGHGAVARVVHSIGKCCSSSFASQVLLLLLLLKC